MAKVKQHMGVAVNGPSPSLAVPVVAPSAAALSPLGAAASSKSRTATRVVALPRGVPAPTLPRVAESPIKAKVAAAPSKATRPLPTGSSRSAEPKAGAPKRPARSTASNGKATPKRDDAKRSTARPGAKQAAGKKTVAQRAATKPVRSLARSAAQGKNASVTRTTSRAKSATVASGSGARRGATKGKAPKGAALGKGANKHRIQAAQLPIARVVKIKALDPYQLCGPRTSVVHLLRVDERQEGSSAVHLVFFDRHGWYCEHGPACRAVEDVRRQSKQLGLTN